MIGNSSLEGLYAIVILGIVVAAVIVIAAILAIIALVYAIRLMSRKLKQQDNEALQRGIT